MDLKIWSREQGQRPPYGIQRGSYNLSKGGSADKDYLPIMVRRITHQGDQARATTDQVMEVGATIEVTAVCLRRLYEDHHQTRDHAEGLQKEVTVTRAEMREFWRCQAIMERRVIGCYH